MDNLDLQPQLDFSEHENGPEQGPPIQPGIYDISSEQYHSGPGISRSNLMTLRDGSPYHFWYKHINENKEPEEPTDAMQFGTALHTLILEPDEFDNRYFVSPKMNRTTKEGKALWAEIKEVAGSREIIFEDTFQELANMREAIEKNQDAVGLIKHKSCQFEKSMYWINPVTGLLCKCRPDILHPKYVGDLKTTTSAKPDKFKYAIRDFGYHIQAAMIQEGIKELTRKTVKDFPYIVVEKTKPYVCAVYFLEDDALARGAAEYQELLITLKQHMDDQHWPGYKTQYVSLPNFY